jgi:hypothetical protein
MKCFNTVDPTRVKLPVATRFLDPLWLANLSRNFTHRSISCVTAKEARKIKSNMFIKCVEIKWMPAGVRSGQEIPETVLDNDLLLVSDCVKWRNEYRCFVKDGKIVTVSQYRNEDGLFCPEEICDHTLLAIQPIVEEAAQSFVNKGVVIDIGLLSDGKYAIIEANECWASGVYYCDPNLVLDTIIAEQKCENERFD